MSERLTFIQACLDRQRPIAEICAEFGVSEKTGHKWIARFRTGGVDALADRTHAPAHARFAVAPAIAARIVILRRRHPLYGPVKLRDWLVQHEPETRWPAASTIGELLRREGLVRARRVRRPGATQHGATQLLRDHPMPADAPNTVWTADFKGQFRLGSGRYCYPLTVLDLHTHFLLRCTALDTTAVAPARTQFQHLFREYGLPRAVRTDNGVPFAQPNAVGHLGALSYWWIRLGIRPDFIRPARPSENGAHERFHKTLKAHTAQPAADTFPAQQRRFDRFRLEYNTERPHASTPAHRPPATTYESSPRPYPEILPPLLYADAQAVRKVDSTGVIKWHTTRIFLSHNLTGEFVGLYETASDRLRVSYAALTLGFFDPHTQRFIPELRWDGC
jgi:transposase InsO family protein